MNDMDLYMEFMGINMEFMGINMDLQKALNGLNMGTSFYGDMWDVSWGYYILVWYTI